MKWNVRYRAWGAAALLMALWACAAESGGAPGDKDQFLPDADYPKMVKRNVKGIQDALKGSPNDEMVEKASTAAVLLAAYAQQNLSGPDGQKRATVRDAALKVADLIKAKNLAEAAKLAGTIPTMDANPDAKKDKVKLIDAYIGPAEIMHQFRLAPDGGWGIFGHLQRIQTKQYKEMPREEVNEAFVLEMYQLAVSADLAHGFVPKTKAKEWEQYTDELRNSSFELANALKAKEVKEAPIILSKLTTTCFNCHKMLKVKNTGS